MYLIDLTGRIGAGDANRTRDPNLGKWSILGPRSSQVATPSSCKPLIQNPNSSQVVPGRLAGTQTNLLPRRGLG